MSDAIDINFLKQAIETSKQVKPSLSHFSVGAILVDHNRAFIASGFTTELGDGWHAEAVAIKKAIDKGFNPKGWTIYSTMEPCSIRSSGKADCSRLLIDKGITRVVFAFNEPPVFVTCEGKNRLKAAGINVEQITDLEKAVIEINKHLLLPKTHETQSKLIAYAICFLLTYSSFVYNQMLASSPQTDDKKPETDKQMQDAQKLIGNYYTQALKQFGGLNKIGVQANNLIDNHGKLDQTQISKAIDSLPVKNEQINKSLGIIKGLVYDPSNPSPFFNNLIALQSMSAVAQSQLIPLAETFLGVKNSYVVGLKANYSQTLKYLEALKQQKVLLEQSMLVPHK